MNIKITKEDAVFLVSILTNRLKATEDIQFYPPYRDQWIGIEYTKEDIKALQSKQVRLNNRRIHYAELKAKIEKLIK